MQPVSLARRLRIDAANAGSILSYNWNNSSATKTPLQNWIIVIYSVMTARMGVNAM